MKVGYSFSIYMIISNTRKKWMVGNVDMLRKGK